MKMLLIRICVFSLLWRGADCFSSAPSSRRTSSSNSFQLFLSSPQQRPPQRRIARRNLQKRRRRSKGGNQSSSAGNSRDVVVEVKPLIKSEAREQGVDYWMDEQELKSYNARQKALRERDPGQVPDEKLWKEVLSPYKQNWIGWVSVFFVIITTIITKFPELLQSPIISIPDL